MFSGGAEADRRARSRGRARVVLAVAGCIAAGATAAGCGLSDHDNLVNGKQQFVSKCGTCHTLARAGTKGTTGPNLDAAFARAREDGLGDTTFKGMVEAQVTHPSLLAQTDPQTGKELPKMPANLVTGTDVSDVAAYVALAAGAGGKDPARLAAAGAKAEGTAKESGGELDIPVNEAGGLLYQFADAEATAGQVTIKSKNDEPIGHDIAIEGNGVSAKGDVVSNGGTSELTANLKPGTYTFYCTVPGHRAAGMEGKLVVK